MFGTHEIEEPKVEGKVLNCLFCGGKRFKQYEVRMFITSKSMFHVPIGGLVGTAYVCRGCGHKHEFYAPG